MEIYEGKCSECGQVQSVMAESQEQADDTVTKECSCGAGRIVEKREMMFDCINRICGDQSEDNGFISMSDDQITLINDIGNAIIGSDFEQAQLKNEDSVTTLTKVKGVIKISRTRTEKISSEA